MEPQFNKQGCIMIDLTITTDGLDECLAALDRDFERLTLEAYKNAESFSDGKDLPICISVDEDRFFPKSATIQWCEVIKDRDDCQMLNSLRSAYGADMSLVEAIPKPSSRSSHRYPDSTFRFLDSKIRKRVLRFEDRLEVIRFALSQNRKLFSRIVDMKVALEERVGCLEGSR